MALSSYRIDISRDEKRGGYGIYDTRFAERPPFEPVYTSGKPLSGRILSKGRGFSLNCELPGLDFKVVRAMLSAGNKSEVHEVLTTKRRSVISPDRVWDGILKFSEKVEPRITDKYYLQSLQELRDQFKIQEKLKPYTFEEACVGIPQNTNPGFPFIEIEPGKKKGEILKKYFNDLKSEWEEISSNRKFILPDCAAFARSAVSSPDKNKVRPVWAYPITVICAEAMFVLPLAMHMKNQDIFQNSAFGMEMMCGGMEFLHNTAKRASTIDPGCKFLMTDYTNFDATIPAWMIRDCFQIIREKFEYGSRKNYYLNALRKVESYFINTPIRNADGRRFLKDHGIPSGTMFTNILGTMCNFLITRYLIKATTQQNPIFDVYFGDDALVCLPEKALINMENLSFQAKKALGVKLNAEKSFWTHKVSNIHFLGYWNAYGSPYKPDSELFASMVYPQYNMDDWAYALARALGCVAASGGQNIAIFRTAQQLLRSAANKGGKIEEADRLVREHPRMIRFFETMGVDPSTIGVNLLTDIRLSIPSSSCEKLKRGVRLC